MEYKTILMLVTAFCTICLLLAAAHSAIFPPARDTPECPSLAEAMDRCEHMCGDYGVSSFEKHPTAAMCTCFTPEGMSWD
jgi:hypothetical protein